MKVTLKDGSSKEYASAMSIYDIAMDISEGLARVAVAGEVDGEVKDLRTTLTTDCTLNILTANDEKGLRVLRHTCSHVMAEAVKRLRPDAKITIGPAIDEGFYYDFDTEPFSREDLDAIEAEMKKIIKEGNKLERFELPRAEAIKFMEEKGEPYKVELINDLPEDSIISFYSQGEGFTDLCAGPHLMSTKGIKAFKLTSSSMAYWRGDANKARLQRIYGSAFANKDDLNAYLEHLEDIKMRDHNKLGREMKLFLTADVIGPGTDYESIGKVDSGAMVDVIGIDDSQEWYKISFVGQEGYVSASYVDFEQDEEEFIEEEEEIETETDASPAEATDEEVEEAPQNYKVIFGLLGAIVVLFFIILVTIKSIKKMDEDEDVEDEEEEYDEDEEEYEEEYDEDEEEYDEDEEEYEEEYDEDEEEYDEDEDEYDDDAYEYQTITIRRPKQSTLDRQKKNDDYLIDIDPSYFD